jgi:hypothetical protein
VGGERGVAIRRGLQDQLGLVVEDVKPVGLAGSAGSTPLRITVKGEPPTYLFAKLYAQGHLRADRWYKLGRELLYGRLEDEKPFNAVRRLGFPDLHSYLVARCQHDASLTQLASELHTTIDVTRRLLDQASIHRSSWKVRSARQRRRATDQRLTQRASQLGFADLGAYLADRVTERAWPLVQLAGELGVHPDTVRDRLDRHGLRRARQTAR